MTFLRTDLPASRTRLILHAGAGGRIREFTDVETEGFRSGLSTAYAAGSRVLDNGGSALEAVTAAVVELENFPLFNAGKGAALTLEGKAELDASVMTGDGRAGAVAGLTTVKNPVLLANVVRCDTPHVLLAGNAEDLAKKHGLDVVDPEYFITEARRAQLARILADREAPLKSGTVGAVARDWRGNLAAATSTGGISKQYAGRIGDTPIIGAGTWASNDALAYSGTGDGEAFLESCLGHDIHARIVYGGAALGDAVEAAFAHGITPRNATGGAIAVGKDGSAVLAHSSAMMFAAFEGHDGLELWT